MTESTPERGKVIAFIGENRRERTVFEGLRDDAATYLMQHYPRLHVEPGSPDKPAPDAVMVDDTNAATYWDGSEWLTYEPPQVTGTQPVQADDRDERIRELEAELAVARTPAPVEPAPTEPVEPVPVEPAAPIE